MVKRRIRLRGITGVVEDRVWETDSILRVGRMETQEISIDDSSVSRRHAEIHPTENGWHVRDLGSTNGTYLNGIRLGAAERRLRPRDIVQFGKLTLVVEQVEEVKENGHADTNPEPLMVEAAFKSSWEDAIQGLAFDDKSPRPGEQLIALLRASHHLGHVENEDQLLHNILNDAVSALEAQRGAIVLADGPAGKLRLRALANGCNDPGTRVNYSQNLASRCFEQGESLLCVSVDKDPTLAAAQSIHEGAMGSVLCVLLRTPRKRLGVLHLDRNNFQKPFTRSDLRLADALAASVSAGIESAMMLRKQRELFMNSITVLGQAVEMRDHYTGGHTNRVTKYSELLGQWLEVSEEELNLIRIGTPLHDIGKIGIDDSILRKPGKLTPEEFEIMKTHTVKGAAILGTIPDLEPAIPIVRSHHEQWSGRGYPDGLKGEAIPRLARIVAVADAFDAMTSDRPYRRGMAAEVAFAEVERQSGRQFDPDCAAAFLAIREQVFRELQSQSGQSTVENIQKTLVPA